MAIQRQVGIVVDNILVLSFQRETYHRMNLKHKETYGVHNSKIPAHKYVQECLERNSYGRMIVSVEELEPVKRWKTAWTTASPRHLGIKCDATSMS